MKRLLNRREFLRAMGWSAVGTLPGCMNIAGHLPSKETGKKPSILLAISDDQSWPHTSIYGCKFVKTPTFDRIARQGILFTHAYSPAPSCSPTRASLLTGRNIWQNEEAAVQASFFPKNLKVYPELLERAGYHVGYTGKGWGPGNWKAGGRRADPVGTRYNKRKHTPPAKGFSENDYAGNFEDFLKARRKGQPFCFWYGGTEPHRPYEAGSGLKAGKKLEDADVPPFLPDVEVVRSELLDYGLEIEWFDYHLGLMLQMLEKAGELDNTIVIVTSDNGMPFPRAKMQDYEFGTHVPLAIRWPDMISAGRTVDDFVSLADFAPTFLEAAGLAVPPEMSGCSLMNIFASPLSGRVDPKRDYVLTGKERHSCARPYNMCYPIRTIRTYEYLYLRNLKPDRWSSGDPPYYLDMHWWVKGEEPSARYILDHKDDENIRKFFELNTARRPAEELYNVEKDPGCLNNLADDPKYAEVKKQLWERLKQTLTEQKDPRMVGNDDFFDGVPCFLKDTVNPKTNEPFFPGFEEIGWYNPKFIRDADRRNKVLRQLLEEAEKNRQE